MVSNKGFICYTTPVINVVADKYVFLKEHSPRKKTKLYDCMTDKKTKTLKISFLPN